MVIKQYISWKFRDIEEYKKALKKANRWYDKHKKTYWIERRFVNNEICYEYKKLIKLKGD